MAKTKYGYCETSDVKATIAGHVYSVKDDENILENGMIVKLGDIVDADEIHSVSTPATTDEVVLICSVLVDPTAQTTADKAEYYAYTDKGEVARAYEIGKRDRFTVADYMITVLDSKSGLQVGNYIVSDGNRKYTEVASPDGYAFAAKIFAIESKSQLTIVRVEVVSNTATA